MSASVFVGVHVCFCEKVSTLFLNSTRSGPQMVQKCCYKREKSGNPASLWSLSWSHSLRKHFVPLQTDLNLNPISPLGNCKALDCLLNVGFCVCKPKCKTKNPGSCWIIWGLNEKVYIKDLAWFLACGRRLENISPFPHSTLHLNLTVLRLCLLQPGSHSVLHCVCARMCAWGMWCVRVCVCV